MAGNGPLTGLYHVFSVTTDVTEAMKRRNGELNFPPSESSFPAFD